MTQSTILFTCICVAIFIAIVVGGGIHIRNEIMRIRLVERRVIREVLSNSIYSELVDDRYDLYSKKYKHVFSDGRIYTHSLLEDNELEDTIKNNLMFSDKHFSLHDLNKCNFNNIIFRLLDKDYVFLPGFLYNTFYNDLYIIPKSNYDEELEVTEDGYDPDENIVMEIDEELEITEDGYDPDETEEILIETDEELEVTEDGYDPDEDCNDKIDDFDDNENNYIKGGENFTYNDSDAYVKSFTSNNKKEDQIEYEMVPIEKNKEVLVHIPESFKGTIVLTITNGSETNIEIEETENVNDTETIAADCNSDDIMESIANDIHPESADARDEVCLDEDIVNDYHDLEDDDLDDTEEE